MVERKIPDLAAGGSSPSFFNFFPTPILVTKELRRSISYCCRDLFKQTGAEEACWAHNPEVPGSKPGSANCCRKRILFFIAPTHHGFVRALSPAPTAAGKLRDLSWRGLKAFPN